MKVCEVAALKRDTTGCLVYVLGVEITTRQPAMTAEYATPEDFATWAARAKTMTVAALLYTVKDCQQAEAAMRGWNPVKEGYYADQASTYGMELTRRQRLQEAA